MDRDSVEYARAAIARLRAGMTARYSFDAWRHYAIAQWEALIQEKADAP